VRSSPKFLTTPHIYHWLRYLRRAAVGKIFVHQEESVRLRKMSGSQDENSHAVSSIYNDGLKTPTALGVVSPPTPSSNNSKEQDQDVNGDSFGEESDSEMSRDSYEKELTEDGLPSLGSALHESGECTRCCFFFKGRCRNGVNCQFCHLQHGKRTRGRGCRGHGMSKKAAAAAAAAASEPVGLKLTTLTPVDLDPAALAMSPQGLKAMPPIQQSLLPEKPTPPAASAAVAAGQTISPKTLLSTIPTAGRMSAPFPVAATLDTRSKEGIIASSLTSTSPCGSFHKTPLQPASRYLMSTPAPSVTLRCGTLTPSGLLSTPAPAVAHKAESETPSSSGQSSHHLVSTLQPDQSETTPGSSQKAKSPIFGTTPVQGETLPRLLGFAPSQKDSAPQVLVGFHQSTLRSGSGPLSTTPAMPHSTQVVATSAQFLQAQTPPTMVEEPIVDSWSSKSTGSPHHIEDTVGKILTAIAKGGDILKQQVHCDANGLSRTGPAKVLARPDLSTTELMADIPPLDPQMPVKKRLPDWTR